MTALSYLYGKKKGTLSSLEKTAIKNAGMMLPYEDSMLEPGRYARSQIEQKNALKKYVASMPSGLRAEVWNMVKKNGVGHFSQDYQDIGKILHAQGAYYHKVVSDAATESAKSLAKQSPAFAAMEVGGYFGTGTGIKLNGSQLKSFLQNKHTTVAEAAQYLPQYAHRYHELYMADKKDLATKNLPPEARRAFEDQKNAAKDALDKTDDLIREIRKAGKDTKLDDGSVDSLAKKNAQALVSSGLPMDIATALASVLSPYLKGFKTGGTGTSVTTTSKIPVGAGGSSNTF